MPENKKVFDTEVRLIGPLNSQPEPKRGEQLSPRPQERISPGESPFTRELILRLIEYIKQY
jgi:hypothetical protein